MQASPDSVTARHAAGGLSSSGSSNWGQQLQGTGGLAKSTLFGKHSEDMPQSATISQASAEPSFKPSHFKVGPRLRAEGVMAPPASDAASLRRQVAALQMDLETHIDGEARLQAINQQLRVRLELYMKQNHENVERAENELNTLHEDMEQTLELQRRLAQKASLLEKEKKELEEALQKRSQEFQTERSSLQSRIDSLSEDVAAKIDVQGRVKALQAELESIAAAKGGLEEQLRVHCSEAESLKVKVEEYKAELAKHVSKEQRNSLLETKAKRVQLRRSFHLFLDGVKERSAVTANETAAANFAKLNCSRRGLRALRLATKRAARMRVSEQRRGRACLQDCWRAWRQSTVARKKFMGSLDHRNRACKCRMMTNWKRAVEMGRLNEDEEKVLSSAAHRHWCESVRRRALISWLQWVLYWARPKHMKLRHLQARLDKLTCKQVVFAWLSVVRTRLCKRLKKGQAELQRRRWLQRRALNRWKSATAMNKVVRNLNSKSLTFWKLHQYQSIIHTWKGFIHLKKNEKLFKTLAFRHYIHALKLKGVVTWRKNVKYQQAEEKAICQVNHALSRAALTMWQGYHAAHGLKKRKEQKALINYNRRERKVAKSMFVFWIEETHARKLALRLAYILASQRMHGKMKSTLKTWIHAAFGRVLVSNVKLQNDLIDAKAQFDDQKDQTNAIDVENLQLIDRLHAMSSEIAMLKLALAEKAKQEEDLHRALEDSALIESSVQGELELQRAQVQDLQHELFKLQRKLQKKNIEDTEGEVHHTMATQKLQRSVKDLQRQLADKNLQLNAYEKALKETAEKLEGASDESHEKLSSAFDIAASLRKLLEDRENQYATLEGNCRRKELELGEVQKKLDVVHSKFCETVEARDARMHELENMLAQKQAEAQEAQADLQEAKATLSSKESLVRKLEYEIKLKSDRESHITRTFITGLSSLSSPRCHGEVTYMSRSGYQHNGPAKHSPLVQHGLEEAIFPHRPEASVPYAFLTKPDSQEDTHSTRSSGSKQAERIQPSEVSRGADDGTTSTSSSSSEDAGLHESTEDERTGGGGGGGTFSTRTDWETSFALVSTTRPVQESSRFITELNVERQSESVEETAQQPSRMVVEEDPRTVNGLHAEIQRLQARIMTRLRDSPGQSEEFLREQKSSSMRSSEP